MSKWIINIHGDIEGDYEIIGKYQEPKTDILDKIKAEFSELVGEYTTQEIWDVIDKYKQESNYDNL